jgi:sec-independent protein translocase protein TatC
MLENIKPHIVELRYRLIIIVLSYIAVFIIVFSNWKIVFDWMLEPLISVLNKENEVIFTSLAEPFFTSLKVSFYTALLIDLPIILYQVWKFIAPGLYKNEAKFLSTFVIFGSAMFLIGSAFAFYIVFPYGFEFLINYGAGMFNAMPKISEYVDFFVKMAFGFGIAFELPVLTFFLAKFGIVTDKILKDFFRYAVIIIFVLSAILTPPDPLTQLFMAIPLIILYGFSILIAQMINPHKEEEENV